MATKDDCGICSACREWTELGNSCCGAPVYFEGFAYTEDYFEDEEESEGEDL